MVQYSKDRRVYGNVFLFVPSHTSHSHFLMPAKAGQSGDITDTLVVNHSTGWGPQPVPLLIEIWRVYTIAGHMPLRHVTQFNGP